MATEQDLKLDQGSRFMMIVSPVIEWLPNLTGYDARGKIKASRTLPGEPTILDLEAYLTVDVASGTVTLDIPGNATTSLDFDRAEYDLELFDSNPAHDVRFLQGEVRMNKEVTT